MNRTKTSVLSAFFAVVLLFQALANVFPFVTSVQAAEARTLRVHLETDTIDNALSLWLWGDVITSSDANGNAWPNGSLFSADQQTDFGYYQDIEIKDDAASIGFVAVYGDEAKYIEEDINIDIHEGVDEVWVREDGSVSYYEPVDFETPTLRIHYLNEDIDYDNHGVWYWGDAPNLPADWPTEAAAFSNEQVGKHGAYVDIPVNEDAGSLGFLIVDRTQDDVKLTGDLSFDSFDTQNQVFVTHEDPTQVFTNPFYISETVEEEGPEETEGTEDITVKASVDRSFNYNEHGLLDVTIENNSELAVDRIEADTSAIGGPSNLAISPELNRVTLSVDHTVQPGTYKIPVSVWDENNGRYNTETEVTIEARNKAEGERDWDEEIIYFMLTDRFANGDETNDNPYKLDYGSADNPRGTYQGGDFKGVTENLDYLDDLGVSTIWVTPIVENVAHDVSFDNDANGSYYAYHGYWAEDFEKLNPHLGTLDEFHTLIDEAAARDIDIMVDVVLNHAGYGMHPTDGIVNPPEGYPTDEDRQRFDDMLRASSGGGDLKMELAGLPDFETERQEVREQLVAWQSAWIEKSTTANGNAVASYRVDTVKHVEDTTWQHFKNELVRKDPSFKLIGESWGASYTSDHGYLNSGMMDSLLDFGFKGIASSFAAGNLEAANATLIERNAALTSDATLGQFLGSHDEDSFLYSQGSDEAKLKLAASLQMTSKGQPVIYYGEELGQSGANNWPEYDNRYDLAWDQVENNEILDHYQKLLAFRNENTELFARGDRETFLGSDDAGWLMVERALADESVYMAFNVSDEPKTVTVETTAAEAQLTDHYSLETMEAMEENGTYSLTFTIPAMQEGGTALLTVESGELVAEEVSEPEEDSQTEGSEIEDGFFRLHFESLPSADPETLGLWIWEDVAAPSENWPTGALSFGDAVETDYGYYLDIELAEDPELIGFLINNTAGANLTEDMNVRLLTPEMNQAWVDSDNMIYPYEPLADDVLRVNYSRTEEDYDGWALWTWEDVLQATSGWPDGAHDLDTVGENGAYFDLPLAENAESVGFLFLNKKSGDQTGDYMFSEAAEHTQVFIKEGDDTIYTNPYYASQAGMDRAELISETEIEVFFHTVEGLTEETLREKLALTNSSAEGQTIDTVTIDNEKNVVTLTGDFSVANGPYTVSFDEKEVNAMMGWRLKDALYAYDGELGLDLREDGTATLKVWSPSADDVRVVLYDKDDQTTIVKDDITMTAKDSGVWEVELDADTTGLDDVTGYYYHFEIARDGETVLALDPYARSMAAWNSSDPDSTIGKAAIVNPSHIGPELDYAEIDGYEKREDAIIYEIHVRDFTSDPEIAGELDSQFGTFSAFVEKLDYIESLGVTHVQLLPVMSYFFANEFASDERLLDYASTDTNYNWGYDPQSYFSLTGMYSENPEDPEQRIEEFKNLIKEIHDRDMGVIMDVVYNHTARTTIFEDLEPNYYHFMDADGTSRESFGGGRLGTTHAMSRRILVDSITYWVEEYKVDGFRFDMMGDHDAESIQMAYDEAKALNPNILMIGEGWRTFAGDEGYEDVQPADQDWMQHTDGVASFSDDMRNELKSGFGSEGEPRFLTGGARSIQRIFDNLTANPHNFTADDPGDVVPYIAAHDNLTLHDVIAQSIQKDPAEHEEEIHQRIRLGNLMVLTAQGTPFIHAGQEYGRTKQFRDPDFIEPVSADKVPYKSTFMTDSNGEPFEYPYFIHDSYDSTDIINRFDWSKVTDEETYPIHTLTKDYTAGLIALRRSTDAFSKGTMEEISEMVSLVDVPEVEENDLVIVYRAEDANGDSYLVMVNADNQERTLTLDSDLTDGYVLVDGKQAGTTPIENPEGLTVSGNTVTLDALTASVLLFTDRDMTDEESDENDDETPADEESDENDDETPADEESDENDDETPADEESDEDDDETSADGDSDENDDETPADEESDEDDDETPADKESDEADEESGEDSLPSTATAVWTVGALGLVSVIAGVGVKMFKNRK
ncbi:pullulanase, extracellular [Alkalibacterium subtropicum]|uniref:pullulanase n=1 Tax=Alkalibacterium subtropicum TaxID=753702 RepID=A0A1I1KQ14_9LACT|nr:pullulanase [Alkalibacterium subtropicum]SFC60768.1 pullulanase, extracellular [Alkalibacterium subtropicum]